MAAAKWRKKRLYDLPADNYFGLSHLHNMGEILPRARIKSIQIKPNKFNMRWECVKLPQWKLLLVVVVWRRIYVSLSLSVFGCFEIFKFYLWMLNSICMWLCFFLLLSLPPSLLFELMESLMGECVCASKLLGICWGRSISFDCLKPRISLFSTKRQSTGTIGFHFLLLCVRVCASIDMIVFHCVYIGSRSSESI